VRVIVFHSESNHLDFYQHGALGGLRMVVKLDAAVDFVVGLGF